MNISIEAQVGELMRQSRMAPNGPAAVALAEEAVRLADSARDLDVGMMARTHLINAAAYGGQNDKLLVAFTWVLAQCDKHPDRFDESDYFWQFKWFGENLPEYPEISRERMFALFDDMETRYKRNGYSIRPVHKVRCNACKLMGDIEGARMWFEKWQNTPRDWNNDCAACETNALGFFQLAFEDFEAARKTCRPILETRRLRCAEVPHVTYARFAAPYLRHGLEEEAVRYHKTGYRMIRDNPDYIRSVGEHLEFVAEHGDIEEGLRMLERHAVWLTHSGSPLEQFSFYVGARKLLGSAQKRARGTSRKLRFHREVPFYRRDGEYHWKDLIAWSDESLDRLANAFDKRNGNDHFSRRAGEAR